MIACSAMEQPPPRGTSGPIQVIFLFRSVIDYFRYDYLFYYFRYYKDILPNSKGQQLVYAFYQLARISELKKV